MAHTGVQHEHEGERESLITWASGFVGEAAGEGAALCAAVLASALSILCLANFAQLFTKATLQ